jgi:2-aminoadipate transaminase
MTNVQPLFARLAGTAERSIIREMLKLAARSGVISLAAGLPDPETFVADDIRRVTDEILKNQAPRALQYGTTEGDALLRDALVAWMAKDGLAANRDDIVITSGSQQGLDIVGRVLLDPGDVVVVELPSYLAALQAFRAYQPAFVGVPMDDEGMEPARLAQVLAQLRGQGRRPKFIYVVPDFQNPSGITWSRARRESLVALAAEFDTLIVEDNPYRELRFSGDAPPPVAALDRYGRTIYLSTFSKTMAPALRIGWIAASQPIIERSVTIKQAMDLCCSSLTQAVAAELLTQGVVARHLPSTIALYRRKRDAMLETLEAEMPAGVTWTRPEGGLFVWARTPSEVDTSALLPEAIQEEGVAYVPGQPFHCDGSGSNTMRLNFSYPPVEQTKEGVRRLARLLRRRVQTSPASVSAK